jgi:MFS family permease
MADASATSVAGGPASNAAIQRRTLHVLMAGQVLGSAALGSAFAVGSFIVKDILGSGRLGGISSAAFTLGAALSSIPLSRLMARRGRRPGLQFGYAVATLGGVVAIVGAQQQQIVVYLVGQLFFGVGNASNLLARYAATDLALPEHRSRAISTVLVCSTFGAILGPTLVAPAEAVAEAFGLYKYTGPYLFSTVFLAGAMVNIALRLRPDPLAVAGRLLPPGAEAPPAPPIRHALAVIRRHPMARLALTSNVVSQVTMVSVMTMTPLHMRDHGHEAISQYVIALHVGGMYAFSPLVGRFADRRGRLPAIRIAGCTLLAACVLAALAADVPAAMFAALWALGLGWSFGLIAGSALLTESVPVAERVAVQGSADLIMSFCGAIAGFTSGFVRESWGFHTLANTGTLLAGLLLVAAVVATRSARRAPGALAPSVGG